MTLTPRLPPTGRAELRSLLASAASSICKGNRLFRVYVPLADIAFCSQGLVFLDPVHHRYPGELQGDKISI